METEQAIGAGQSHEMSRERLARVRGFHVARRIEENYQGVAALEDSIVAVSSLVPLHRDPDGTITYV